MVCLLKSHTLLTTRLVLRANLVAIRKVPVNVSEKTERIGVRIKNVTRD